MKKHFVKPKKALIFVAAAVLALSATAFAAGHTIFNRLDTTILEGEEYVRNFNIKVSEDGETYLVQMDLEDDAGLVVADIEGEARVLRDPLVLTNLEEAKSLFAPDHFMIPGELPAGFQFDHVEFAIDPRTHDQEGADQFLTVDFTDGSDFIRMTVSAWDESWGLPIMGAQEDIVINGHPAAIMEGVVIVLANNVLYTIAATGDDITLSQETLLQMAESLN